MIFLTFRRYIVEIFPIRLKTLSNQSSDQSIDFILTFYIFPWKISIEFDRFYDPDIVSPTDKYNVVDKYEYTIADNSTNGKVHTQWDTITATPSAQKVQIIPLTKNLSITHFTLLT